MNVVVLGLVSALLFGVSDFLGGLAARTQPATRSAFVAMVVCLLVVVPALAIVPSVASVPAVTLGALAGIAAGVGLLMLYAALAAGPVGFVAPFVALMCAVLPAVFGFATGEAVTPAAAIALGAVVVGGVLIGVEPDAGLRPSRRTVLLSVATGVVYASYFVFIDATPADSGAVPMVADSVAAVITVGGILIVTERRTSARSIVRARSASGTRPLPSTHPLPNRREGGAMIGAGLMQGVGTVLLVLALHLPGLAVVSALSALYPVTTVGLAVLVVHERLKPYQVTGLVVAIGGVAALALATG